MSPERLGAAVVRWTIYAGCAAAYAFVVHARAPNAPAPVAFAIVLFGIAAYVVSRCVVRRRRQTLTEGRTPAS